MPQYSRDGEKIYYDSGDGLCVMDKNGENQKLVFTEFSAGFWGFKISPCGKKIVYGTGADFRVLNLETLKKTIIRR